MREREGDQCAEEKKEREKKSSLQKE